jgi:predicted AlkP superfamily phosphohydrolase/phosphomutase
MEHSNPQKLRSATLIRRITSPTKSLKKNDPTDLTVAADAATVEEVEVAVEAMDEEAAVATAEVAVATAVVAEVTVEAAAEDTATEIADVTDTRLRMQPTAAVNFSEFFFLFPFKFLWFCLMKDEHRLAVHI